jgi:hypothetical protein
MRSWPLLRYVAFVWNFGNARRASLTVAAALLCTSVCCMAVNSQLSNEASSVHRLTLAVGCCEHLRLKILAGQGQWEMYCSECRKWNCNDLHMFSESCEL